MDKKSINFTHSYVNVFEKRDDHNQYGVTAYGTLMSFLEAVTIKQKVFHLAVSNGSEKISMDVQITCIKNPKKSSSSDLYFEGIASRKDDYSKEFKITGWLNF